MATACITGASSGIGKEFAKLLASKGYNLILIARSTDKLKEIASRLPVKCKIITCDLSSETACLKLCETLKKYKIDILINNAGFGNFGSFTKTPIEKDMSMINVNIKSLHIITRQLLPEFVKRDSGYILNVASSAGLLPGGPYMAAYYATKAYVTSLTSAIYQELKESKSNVHISMLCPGPVDTNFNNVASVKFAIPGISASKCASYALNQMFKGKLTIVPSAVMKFAVTGARFVPRKLLLSITAFQQKKKQ